ncbi:CAT RNA binding domain-containing protein [Neobacillus cucumis]|nr:CAT RNA binding domain-containing protein [Neobacillus cucumis]MDR4947132.1 CAT RNA binding domain-containing protein [Neobacillus cucumis]
MNNNAAICIDSAGNELVAIGTGMGFPPIPYNNVRRTVSAVLFLISK